MLYFHRRKSPENAIGVVVNYINGLMILQRP